MRAAAKPMWKRNEPCSRVWAWLRQPTTYSDREWILAIAKQYRQLDRAGVAAAS